MIARSALGATARKAARALQVVSVPGIPLPTAERGHLESRFRRDFAHVRVHAGEAADRSTADLGTDAYTLGHDIVVRAGADGVRGPRGRALLEHEALHTLQAAPPGADALPEVAARGSAPERGVAAAAREGGEPRGALDKPAILCAPPSGDLDLGEGLAENADPMMARVVGSTTIDGFALGHAELSPKNQAELDRVAKRLATLLLRFPGSRIHITGHTDAVGGEERNEALGLDRAQAAKQELVAAGVRADAVDVESKGKSELLVPAKGAEPRNRRAAIQFEPASGPRLRAGPHLDLSGPSPSQTPQLPGIGSTPSYGMSQSPGPQLSPNWSAPLPPLKATPDKSPYAALNERIDHDLRGLQPHLPRWLYDQLRNGTHAAAKGLINKVLEGAIDAGPLPPQVKAILSKLLELLEKKPSDFTKGPDPANLGSPDSPPRPDFGSSHDLPPAPGVIQAPPIRF